MYLQFQITATKSQAEANEKATDSLETKVNNLDGEVHNHDKVLATENAKLKDEIAYLMRTCKTYEERFREMESEMQVRMKYLRLKRLEVLQIQPK